MARCEVRESILNGEEDHGWRDRGEKATSGLSVDFTEGSSKEQGQEGMMELQCVRLCVLGQKF